MNDILAVVVRTIKAHTIIPVEHHVPRAIPRAIPEPARIASRYERDIARTGAFVSEGVVTDWGTQPGTQIARLSVQDPEMNAVMQGSGQTNYSLSIPVEVASYIPPRARVRVTIEVL